MEESKSAAFCSVTIGDPFTSNPKSLPARSCFAGMTSPPEAISDNGYFTDLSVTSATCCIKRTALSISRLRVLGHWASSEVMLVTSGDSLRTTILFNSVESAAIRSVIF